MTQTLFFNQLAKLSVFVALLLACLHLIPPLQPFHMLSIVTCPVFIALSILMYFVGQKAADSPNKFAFNNVIIGFMMGKMLLSVILILIYNEWMQPTNKLFLLPFFIIYLLYTIFETYFMMKLGKPE